MDIDTPYTLGPAAAKQFDDDGYIRLPGVLDADTIAAFEPEITSKVLELNTLHLPMAERSTYQKAFLQVANLWRHSELVRRFVFSARLARIAAELMGVDGVRLYHDQALYKETSGGITPWHADQYYWPLSTDRACTVWVPLQETPHEMGPLEFAAGSHRFEYGRDLPIGDESESALQTALAEQGFPVSSEPYALGDISYHQGWTFHRAGPNQTPTPRRVMTIIYIDADMTVSTPTNHHQEVDLTTWMPGASPGDVPNTELNPTLYHH
ncbi:phytanoyl-CoA dioxygenase family protein [Phytoactinopolyspora alkaliphila]|uniref:Phytanoyl-CoA dioxygenase family protein n=1 Tax=Phytoactinopolyspora alkaliphila TaxID=1783498 RepID=A0A6N9YSD2_9ACTN|nr:phytanoyl-CoA dioxygenase family protein [Phytoactinopolyspora alkaliphila]NED97860.1 phytanoyl-CoA dioxygenase family protein [Phytoactinopolyspora alkaliphila]